MGLQGQGQAPRTLYLLPPLLPQGSAPEIQKGSEKELSPYYEGEVDIWVRYTGETKFHLMKRNTKGITTNMSLGATVNQLLWWEGIEEIMVKKK